MTLYHTLVAPDQVPNLSIPVEHFSGYCAKYSAVLNTPFVYDKLDPTISDRARFALVVLNSSLADLSSNFIEYAAGKMPQRPYLELTCPAAAFEDARCGGHDTLSAFTMLIPSPSGSEAEPARRRAKLRGVLRREIGRVSSLLERDPFWEDLMLPDDLERVLGMYAGNVDHGDMSPENLFASRPSKAAPGPTTPFRNVFLCGSGSHPGGLVSGLPALNAVEALLKAVGRV
jgi:phytoene dehydrogenase-like protein